MIKYNRYILNIDQKALDINLDDKIYGTFAEIGAGQEVARNFFQVGAAAGTIAKTMSAYDKTYSDAIYGEEDKKRYVSISRVKKMLDHEYQLLVERLQDELPETSFFAFADTVAAINYQRTIKGQGWLGIRFQLDPNGEPNDLIIHAKLKDSTNRLQQEAIGMLGVNMVYACYFIKDNMDVFVQSLGDHLENRVQIDFISLNGKSFDMVDNRLLNLYLIKYGLSDVAMFDAKGESIHASELLYKKNIMVVRGNFRPPTLVTTDVFDKSYKQFKDGLGEEAGKSQLLAEITLEYLRKEDNMTDQDFLDRADMLCGLGHTVIVSDQSNHQTLINYLSDYKTKKLGIVIGVKELLEIINEKYYQNQDGHLLVAFGELFTRNIVIYAYPALFDEDSKDIMTRENLPVPRGILFLYKYLIDTNQIVDVKNYNKDILNIFPVNVVKSIQKNTPYWEKSVPEVLIPIIKEKKSFGYQTYCDLDEGIHIRN